MKIFEIVADGHPGGGTTVVLTLAEGLHARGDHEVHLVTQTESYAFGVLPEVRRHGLHFFPYRVNPATVWQLAHLLRRERPDIVHAHGARAALNVVLARRLGAPSVPMIYTVHGYQLGGGEGLLRRGAVLAEKWCHATAARNVFVSNHDRERSILDGFRSPAQHAVTIPNGLRLDELPAPASTDLKTVAFLGRLTRPKNPMLLLDIADRLRGDGYRLKVIGGGDMEAQLREGVARRGLGEMMTITGTLPRRAALEELRGAGAMVLPSLWEGLPVSVIEAMAMRVPVVAAAVCGIPEIVRDGETGLLVAGQDADGYAAALKRLTTDRTLRERVIAAGEALAKSEYRASAMVDRHLALYRELFEQSTRAPARG